MRRIVEGRRPLDLFTIRLGGLFPREYVEYDGKHEPQPDQVRMGNLIKLAADNEYDQQRDHGIRIREVEP